MSAEAEGRGAHPLRWAIVSLLFLGTVVNYMDRQTLATLAPVLERDLHFSNFDYGRVGSCFLLAYALSMWAWGAVFDRVGNRLGYSLAVGWWSLAEAGHALARTLGSLSFARGALGVGESGNWPGATRTIAAWFASGQRALAMGIVNAGAGLGPALAAPVIVWLQLAYGWRTVFVATGAFGLAWMALWLLVYPRKSSVAAPPPAPAVSWRVLFARREFWGIFLARFFGDPIWWLYLNWLPKYLYDVRGFSLKEIGLFAWVPFAAAAFGGVCGGALSGGLIAAGWSVNRARKTAIGIATLLLLVGGLAAVKAPTPALALACMSVATFGFQFWVGNVQTLPSDFFPIGAVGSIAGFSGTAAGLGSAIFTFSTGWVVDHFSYTPILITAALLGPVATACLFLLAGRIRRLDIAAA